VLVLCLDTATADVAAAVVDVTAERRVTRAVAIRRDPRGAGEHLIPLITEAVASAGATLADLGAIAVGLGPGPFTGLRAGVVTGAVLARTLGIPAYGSCSLDAYGEPDVVVTTDARRREVYWAAYGPDGTRVGEPNVDRPAELADRLPNAHFIGPGVPLYPDLLAPDLLGDERGLAADNRPFPVERLAEFVVGRALAAAPGEVLVPLYLRRPDATEPAAVGKAAIGGSK
jgi:tRNA threonylcarbamoyl adenosine modification protein YeaZ